MTSDHDSVIVRGVLRPAGHADARVGQTRHASARAPRDQRYESAYIFGAVCPQRSATAALVLPCANAEAMNLHLEEISNQVAAAGAHTVFLLDGAGYHKETALDLPQNITLLPLPPYSPELNPAENIWGYLRGNTLANTVYETYDEIVDTVCEAWMLFANDNERVASIATANGQRSMFRAVGIREPRGDSEAIHPLLWPCGCDAVFPQSKCLRTRSITPDLNRPSASSSAAISGPFGEKET
jgi:putative transposase